MAVDFLAEVLIYKFFSLLCGHPAAKGFLKGLIFFFFWSLLNDLLLWKLILAKLIEFSLE